MTSIATTFRSWSIFLKSWALAQNAKKFNLLVKILCTFKKHLLHNMLYYCMIIFIQQALSNSSFFLVVHCKLSICNCLFFNISSFVNKKYKNLLIWFRSKFNGCNFPCSSDGCSGSIFKCYVDIETRSSR